MSREKFPFPKLPRTSSPEALDDRIVSEARRLAPAKQPRLFPGWVPALATVSLVAAAVVVIRPVFQSLETEPAVMDSAREKPAAAEFGSESEAQPVLESDQPTNIKPQSTAAHSMGTADVQTRQSVSVLQEEQPVETEAKPETTIQAIPQDQGQGVAPSASSQMMKTESQALGENVAPERGLTDDEYRHLVNKILELLEAGKTEEASRMLEQLRLLCPQCDLPDEPEQLTLPE